MKIEVVEPRFLALQNLQIFFSSLPRMVLRFLSHLVSFIDLNKNTD